MNKKSIGFTLGAAAVIFVITAVLLHRPSSHTMTTAPTVDVSSAVATNAVSIQDYMFNPMVIKVKVGTTVTWTNQDSVHHNVVADTISSDAPNGPLICKGETYSFTFKKVGTYIFHCMPHPYMHGTVVVTN